MRIGKKASKTGRSRAMANDRRALLALAVFGCAEPALADIALAPVVTQHAAAHDKDGVWRDRDFLPVGEPLDRPNIYTAKVETADGIFFLSQITAGCRRYLCPFQLRFIGKTGKSRLLASDYGDWGGIVTLSTDYRQVTFGTFRTEQTITIPEWRDRGKTADADDGFTLGSQK